MPDAKYQISNVPYQIANAQCQISNAKYQNTNFNILLRPLPPMRVFWDPLSRLSLTCCMPDAKYQISNAKYQTLNANYQISTNVKCRILPTSNLRENTKQAIFPLSTLTLFAWASYSFVTANAAEEQWEAFKRGLNLNPDGTVKLEDAEAFMDAMPGPVAASLARLSTQDDAFFEKAKRR